MASRKVSGAYGLTAGGCARDSRLAGCFSLSISSCTPCLSVLASGDGRIRVGIELQQVFAQGWVERAGVLADQKIDQVRIGCVGQAIFPGPGFVSGVAVAIGQVELSALCFYLPEKASVVLQSVVDTLDVHVLGLSRGDLEVDGLERSHLWNQFDEECKDSGSDPGFAIHGAPLVFVVAAREVIEKFL